MAKFLQILPDTRQKQTLRKSIDQKMRLLSQWKEKVEMLRIDLEMIKHEYDVRIGYLLLKDNQLDLEIIQLKNLKHLMEEGMTYQEAVAAEEDKFYNEILRMQEEAKKINEEKEILDNRVDVTPKEEEEIKALWKKLIRKFHPDLVQGIDEKREREKIMKLINAAYAIRDKEALKQIALTSTIRSIKQMTIEDLEQELVRLENSIIFAQGEWKELKISEWFGWKKRIEKAKKTDEDLFAQLEKNLLDDIAKKITLARKLREEVNPQVVL